jgi:hypothetical protein
MIVLLNNRATLDDGTITDTEAGYSPLAGTPPTSEGRDLIRPRCGNTMPPLQQPPG